MAEELIMENNNNFNFNNLTYIEDENNNLNVEQNLTKIFSEIVPENIHDDDFLKWFVYGETIFKLFKKSSYYNEVKEITSTIKKLRESVLIRELKEENFEQLKNLKIALINSVKDVQNLLQKYRELIKKGGGDEETGELKNVFNIGYLNSQIKDIKEVLKNADDGNNEKIVKDILNEVEDYKENLELENFKILNKKTNRDYYDEKDSWKNLEMLQNNINFETLKSNLPKVEHYWALRLIRKNGSLVTINSLNTVITKYITELKNINYYYDNELKEACELYKKVRTKLKDLFNSFKKNKLIDEYGQILSKEAFKIFNENLIKLQELGAHIREKSDEICSSEAFMEKKLNIEKINVEQKKCEISPFEYSPYCRFFNNLRHPINSLFEIGNLTPTQKICLQDAIVSGRRKALKQYNLLKKEEKLNEHGKILNAADEKTMQQIFREIVESLNQLLSKFGEDELKVDLKNYKFKK